MDRWRTSCLTEPAVFLDRDGTVCKHVPYLSTVERFELLPTAAEGIRRLNKRGWPVIVVTNQSGIGRGYFSRDDAAAVHREMEARLRAAGAAVDDVYLCPHHPEDECKCRKPEPGLLRRAAVDHGIELTASVIVGDRASDIAAGRRVGCTTVLFPSPETCSIDEIPADYTVNSFVEATERVLSEIG